MSRSTLDLTFQANNLPVPLLSSGGITTYQSLLTVLSTSGVVMEKVVEYFQYWYKNRDKEDVPDMEIPVELCLVLVQAADYFNLDSKLMTAREA